MKLSNLRLLVQDFDKAYTFYNQTLGLECTWGKPGENFASFNIGLESGLAIFKADLMNAAINKPDTAGSNPPQDKFTIIIQVDKVDNTYQTLIANGVSFITQPMDMTAWGIRVAHFRDTENNLLEIFSPL